MDGFDVAPSQASLVPTLDAPVADAAPDHAAGSAPQALPTEDVDYELDDVNSNPVMLVALRIIDAMHSRFGRALFLFRIFVYLCFLMY